jgi:hypothetical protein
VKSDSLALSAGWSATQKFRCSTVREHESLVRFIHHANHSQHTSEARLRAAIAPPRDPRQNPKNQEPYRCRSNVCGWLAAVREKSVATLVALTVAVVTTAPCASLTVPTMVPVTCWPSAAIEPHRASASSAMYRAPVPESWPSQFTVTATVVEAVRAPLEPVTVTV